MFSSKIIIPLFGATNVGKSTLFNKLTNIKKSIITQKKNTTNRCISHLINKNTLIIDTPGPIFKKKNTINKLIYNILKISYVSIVMIDLTSLKTNDFFIFELIKKKSKNLKFLLINKIDKLKNKTKLLSFISKIQKYTHFHQIIPISSKNNTNINRINSEIKKISNINKVKKSLFYEQDSLYNDTIDIIRETLLKKLEKELPYAIKIQIENDNLNKESTSIDIKLTTEKKNQKKIIIGKNGDKIKFIKNNITKNIRKLYKKLKHIKIYINNK